MKPLTSSQRELLARATAAYRTQLEDSEEVRSYLRERGLVSKSGDRFQLGAVIEPFVPEHKRFVGTLVIPNICAAGESGSHVVGLKFRRIDGSEPKYDQPAGQVARLFHLRAIQEAEGDTLICTEGEMDCMTVDMLGLPCIGVPGAQSWGTQAHRARLLAGFQRVVLIRDADKAGGDLVKTMHDVDQLEVRTPPDGMKDVNEFWCATHDAEAVRSWILATT